MKTFLLIWTLTTTSSDGTIMVDTNQEVLEGFHITECYKEANIIKNDLMSNDNSTFRFDCINVNIEEV